MKSKRDKVVPFFVLHMGPGVARAQFSVPPHLVNRLAVHPIVCRGSTFTLQPDSNNSYFLKVEYESIDAEATAADISRRLARRIHQYPERKPPPPLTSPQADEIIQIMAQNMMHLRGYDEQSTVTL